MSKLTLRSLATLSCLAGFALLNTGAHAQLVIIPTFGASITSNVNAGAIENSINQAIQFYQATYTNPVTIRITFEDMNSGLGQSATFVSNVAYSDYYTALVAHATTANDALALSHITPGTDNPVNGNTQIRLTTPNLRLLGFSEGDLGIGTDDSTISVNFGISNLDRTTIDPDKYDLLSTLYHEINEVLGFGSSLNGSPNDPVVNPTGAINSLDLYRYDQNGNRTLNSDVNSEAYFSLDGVTRIKRFNLTTGGDFHDWFSADGLQAPSVQNAFNNPGIFSDNGISELTALDVIGYTARLSSSSVPEPGSVAMLVGMGATAAGFALRRRSRKK